MTRKRSEVPQMRGVQAFLSPSNSVTTSPAADNLLPISKIHLPAKQPRRYFDSGKLNQLIQSIQAHGILEPLLIRPLENGEYELVAGERRYRAAQAIGLQDIPVTIREFNDKEALQVALIENLQREDLNPLEETEGILDLMTLELNCSRDELISLLNRAANAKKRGQELTKNVLRQIEQVESLFAIIGRITPESFRTSRLPLLNLPPEILTALHEGQIAYTKAQAIARIKNEQQRQQLLDESIHKDFSLVQIKEKITRLTAANQTDSDELPLSLKQRVNQTLRAVKRSKALDNPQKAKKLKNFSFSSKL